MPRHADAKVATRVDDPLRHADGGEYGGIAQGIAVDERLQADISEGAHCGHDLVEPIAMCRELSVHHVEAFDIAAGRELRRLDPEGFFRVCDTEERRRIGKLNKLVLVDDIQAVKVARLEEAT